MYNIGDIVFLKEPLPNILFAGEKLKIIGSHNPRQTYDCQSVKGDPKQTACFEIGINNVTHIPPRFSIGDIVQENGTMKTYEIKTIQQFRVFEQCWAYVCLEVNSSNPSKNPMRFIDQDPNEFSLYISKVKMKALGVNEDFLNALNKNTEKTITSNAGRSTCYKCGKPTTDLALLVGTTKYCKDCDF